MSDVRVTIGANSAPLESEFEKVKNSARGLKKSVGDVGGVLEGDRRVENKMTSWVEGFKSAQNGADVLANTMGNLGDVFKSSLAVGVGLNVGAALVGMLGSAIAKADEEWKNFQKDGVNAMASINQAMAGGEAEKALEEIAKRLEQISAQREKMSGFLGTMPKDLKSWAGALSGGMGGAILQKNETASKNTEIAKEQAKLEKDRVNSAEILLGKKEQEAEIANLIANGETEAAKQIEAQNALVSELNKVKSLNLNNTKEELALQEKIIAAIGQKGGAKAIGESERVESEKLAKTQEAEKKQIAAEQEAVEHFNEWKAEQEATALKQKQDDEDKALKLGMEAFGRHEAEKTRIADEEEKKRLKAIEDADKLRLEGNKEWLKEQQDIVKKGEQEQKQRDDRAMQALQGGGGLQALQAQRLSDRQAEAAREKAAGIAARDEIRRKYGGDATKMTKEEIEAVKSRILGEKQLDKKKIEDAIAGIPKIEAEIAKLVAKLGVK